MDSDEDVITDYLPGAADCLSAGGRLHNTLGIPTQHHPHIDIMSAQQRAAAVAAVAAAQQQASPLVPTISVTPHSPAAKHYPVLGK